MKITWDKNAVFALNEEVNVLYPITDECWKQIQWIEFYDALYNKASVIVTVKGHTTFDKTELEEVMKRQIASNVRQFIPIMWVADFTFVKRWYVFYLKVFLNEDDYDIIICHITSSKEVGKVVDTIVLNL